MLGQCFGAFWGALTVKSPARVEPMRLNLKKGVNVSHVKSKPRVYPSDKSAWLKAPSEAFV